MDNKVFYIRYRENAAVPVETHITSERTRREFPLETIAHLIQGLFTLYEYL